mmetsp:Transcript_19665/g.27450  ORF Transcript_19665/g.27450 Transcript_19665/m.27450 type:complete len:508 (+) Transcript_19665:83-1606(+)
MMERGKQLTPVLDYDESGESSEAKSLDIDTANERDSTPLMKSPAINLDKILSKIGVGRFHWKLMAICGAGWTADNGWTQTVVLILPSVQREFGVKDWQIGFIGTALFSGMAVGSHFWGRWSDTTGRKFAFNSTLLLAGAFGLSAAASPNFALLIVLYFFLGTGVGGNLPVDGAMFVEFTPRLERGRLMVLLSVFWSLGGFLVALMAWAIIPSNSCSEGSDCTWHDNMGWRYVVGGFGVMNLVVVFLRAGLPETPAYLMKTGNTQRALEVLNAMARENGANDEAFSLISELGDGNSLNMDDDSKNETGGSFRELFRGRHMFLTTILLWSIWFCSTYAYTGFNMFLTKLLEAKHIESSNVYRDALIYSAAGVPGSLLGSRLVETFLGRKWTMVGSTGITACCMLLFYLVHNELEVVIMSCLINVSSCVMFAAYYTYTPEVYRTAVRGTGVGVASGLSRVSGVVAPLASSGLLSLESGVTLIMLLNFSLMAATTVCMITLPIRTKGRALE